MVGGVGEQPRAGRPCGRVVEQRLGRGGRTVARAAAGARALGRVQAVGDTLDLGLDAAQEERVLARAVHIERGLGDADRAGQLTGADAVQAVGGERVGEHREVELRTRAGHAPEYVLEPPGSSSTVRYELVEQPSTTCRRARLLAAPSVAGMSTIVDGSTAPAGLAGRMGPLPGPLAAAGSTHWEPEDEAFWEATGKRIARKNLVFSIFAENIGFSIWVLWTIVVLNLANVGHRRCRCPSCSG